MEMRIKEILTIDLSEDIKNVIDLEDVSEVEIQSEIENYIITDGLAREYSDFVSTFTSNILETGVWISGFYGSGKSYFGKLLVYLLNNHNILGTPARDRIMQRFTGINDEALIKNSLAKLNNENCRVVFFDVAKQDTSKGLSFALFRNFLKSLELPENEHGFFLYQMMINDKQSNIHDFINSSLKKNWSDIKTRMFEYVKTSKSIFIQNGNNESDYDNLMSTIRRDMDQFSASRLKDELNNYLQINNSEKVIFLFDEASEAINQNKFSLLDLEGISESLSALGGKVWTIAIAQEKLDDVINNSNVSKAQLTKVTDRFKTKIHLEATEVDVIIRSRLLSKNDNAINKLKEYYVENSGKINDHAALQATGITKTDSVDSYITYYPFYQCQFNLLQNFLFGTKGYASTKVAARGMIITTYDILKRELQEKELYDTATGWQIVKQAQPQPNVMLVNRYENAERILKSSESNINGRKLLETIRFLSEAEVVPTTLPNIIKSFISDPDDYHKLQEDITKALNDLVEAKVILLTNNTYRITSDIEQRLLEEMIGFTVQGFVKKKHVVKAYKNASIIKTLTRITEGNLPYDFYITTDNDDELTNPPTKQLKLRLKSVYNISDDRTSDIDTIKTQSQNDKDLIWIVPDNSSFNQIDKLVDEIERITYLGEKYNNPHSEEYRIIQNFSKFEKEIHLKDLIEQSLQKATSIYLYNTFQLDKDNWLSTIQKQQRNVIENVYSKRLASQLNDEVAVKVIKEANNARLQTYFHGSDFLFFDAQGNFIGEHLKVVEEILIKIGNTFVDGASIEKTLQQPPTGFAFGTVISTIAVLMRAGRIIAKYNGSEKFSWRDEGVNSIFSSATQYRKASFKSIAKSLSAQQKNDIVTALQDLKCENHIGRKVDWNTNDFDLASAIKDLAKRFIDKVDDMRKQNKEFDTLFADLEVQTEILSGFTGSVSETNYIEKAENYLIDKDDFNHAIHTIEKAGKFIRNNLNKLLEWKTFASDVNDELIKSAGTHNDIHKLLQDINNLMETNVVKNFPVIQQTAQKIRDEYFELMKNAAKEMSEKYIKLKSDAENFIKDIDSCPNGLNDHALNKTKTIINFANQRIQSTVDIEYDVKDKNTRFTYSEMLSFIDLFNGKNTELEILKAGLIREVPPEPEPGKPKPRPSYKLSTSNLPAQKLKVSKYKIWLHQELQKLSRFSDNDEIEVKEG